MRTVVRSNEFDDFYNGLSPKVKDKLEYAISILIELKVVNSKLVKRLVGSDFYELRISVGNEYRVILLTIDHDNLIEATQLILLNGFMKKSTKDYKKQIERANNILNDLEI
ncbi:MAG: type II toxin-antitoxin system RelE/ParE family toxin [Rikenellaceae bacterium]